MSIDKILGSAQRPSKDVMATDLTMRDYFAIRLMVTDAAVRAEKAMANGHSASAVEDALRVDARNAYAMADLMIEERSK